jgi:hemolysin activation/secretion protein
VPVRRLPWVASLLVWIPLALAQPKPAPSAPRFEIKSFVVQGSTLLPQREVDRIVAPYTGPGKDFGSVQQALEALQEAYLARGYNAVRVSVPEQDLVGGQVRLQVVEARVRAVRVEQNRYFDEANVRAGMPSLRAGEAPNTRRIGENVQLVNENPAKQVTVRLEATEQIGAVDAVVRVNDDKPGRFTTFLDNTGNPQTGQLRAGVGYQHANVWNRDHVFSAQYVTSPTEASDVSIFGVGYRAPIYRWNGAVDLVAGYSDVDSGTIQNLFTVSGKGSIFGARYTQILRRIESYEQKLSVGWDYRAFEQHVALIGTTTSLVPDITVRPISLAYAGRLSRVGSDLNFNLAVSRNLPGSGDAGKDAFDAQRFGAEPKYTILRGAASYSYILPRDFILRTAGNFQYTDDLLVPGEQFGLGGADSVRGFYEREIAFDEGWRVSGELYSPDFGPSTDWRVRALTFVDGGRGSDNAPERNLRDGIASAGIGLRVNRGRTIFLRADWAYVLRGSNATREKGEDRFHAAIGYSY